MASTSAPNSLDIAEQVARVLRSNAETQKFIDEQAKLRAEAEKLARDRALAPWQIVLSSMAAGAALFGAGAAFIKVFGA
ncbi:hypothetical protein [Methylobacterium sp. Leaf106]|uniref:hypothetical protein n=1 Tax=Methylobacterium sp. Leaf106 TaxID=1736255 RepID=UPI0006FE0F99|nr:hypothetical protein [Methylobacterium sp. Leaf106]KQP53010.1 hypothetical protein ASF34_01160 [Methylobacterium sp. Leaf106]